MNVRAELEALRRALAPEQEVVGYEVHWPNCECGCDRNDPNTISMKWPEEYGEEL